MEQRQEMSPEMQLYIIATDVNEVKELVTKLDGTVKEIHVSLVGERDKPGVFEELRKLKSHTHPEFVTLGDQIASVDTRMRIFTARILAGLGVFLTIMEIALK